MKFLRENFKWIGLFFVVYAFLYGTYLLFSVGLPTRAMGLQARRYIPCALVVTLAVKLWISVGLPKIRLILPAIISLCWVVLFPAIHWLTYHNNVGIIDNRFDQAFASYSFAAYIGVFILVRKFANSLIATCTSTLAQIFLLFLPVLQIIYYALYQSPVTSAGWLAILQTNTSEAKEYIAVNLGYTGTVLVVLALLALLYFLIRNNYRTWSCKIFLGKTEIIGALVLALACTIYSSKIYNDVGVVEHYRFAKDYFNSASAFKEKHEKNFADLQVTPTKPAFSKPSTIIFIIGESASREYMSAYNKALQCDSTPWLKKMLQEKQFVSIDNSYSSWAQTVPVLERTLTEKNQYNTKEFNDSVTIIDLAKKAGYKTYWLSDQGYISEVDTPITLVAQTADEKVWLCDKFFNTDKKYYDGDLLPLLKDINPNENNFVVLHFAGSHQDAILRYPSEKARFAKPGEYDPLINYYDSLAYTDEVLRDVYEYGRKHLNLQAMIYFSDHGSHPRERRLPDAKGFGTKHIPFVMWFSDEYKNLYPETAKLLDTVSQRYFTNDLMYDTLADVLQVKSNKVDETCSVLSPKYRFNRDNLVTDLGKTKISDDE